MCSPEAIAGQPASCAGVGAWKARANHSRVAGVKRSSTLTPSASQALPVAIGVAASVPLRAARTSVRFRAVSIIAAVIVATALRPGSSGRLIPPPIVAVAPRGRARHAGRRRDRRRPRRDPGTLDRERRRLAVQPAPDRQDPRREGVEVSWLRAGTRDGLARTQIAIDVTSASGKETAYLLQVGKPLELAIVRTVHGTTTRPTVFSR